MFDTAGLPPLPRRLIAEALGTAFVVLVVIGSGIAGHRLSKTDAGLQVLESGVASAIALGVAMIAFGGISGGHFNPVISAVVWFRTRRSAAGLPGLEAAGYVAAQLTGGILGAVAANLVFDLPAFQVSGAHRVTSGHLLGEALASVVLIFIVFAARQADGPALPAVSMSAFVGTAFWFTGSLSFVANPAVTVARMFSNTFNGIAPASVPAFVAAQLGGALVGVGMMLLLAGRPASASRRTVVRRAKTQTVKPAVVAADGA